MVGWHHQLHGNEFELWEMVKDREAWHAEIIDISPGNLDSSLCFIQSSISHDVLCI